MTLEVPALGVTMVVQDGCNITVVGTVPTRKAGELATALSSAKAECLAAQARVTEQARRDAVAIARAPGEAKLMSDAGIAVVTGKDVKVVVTEDRFAVESGQHLQWEAYATALNAGDSRMYAPGLYASGGDPNLLRLGGVQMGTLYATPTVPGQVAPVVADTAACGTAQECQATIDAQAAAMASADK